jgi:urease accessory protein UreE
VDLRQEATAESVVLERRLAQLVRERQELRDGEASQFVLEQNRLEIVRTQLELSQALVSEHLEVASG